MSLHKGNHAKTKLFIGTVGELPATDVKVSAAELAALRQNPRLRSPYGFCTSKRSLGPKGH